MTEKLSVSIEGAVLHLRLNRPEKKNALDGELYDALSAGLERGAQDDAVRAVVLSAEGPDFCAGNDLADFPVIAAHRGPPEDLPVFRFLRALVFFPKPLLAAVQGQAVGIGTTLLLHCDQVWLGEDARLSLPFVKLGLVPEAGSSLILPQRVGHVRAFEWLTSGRILPAVEAREWGLVNGIVEAPVPRALTEAEALARLSPEAVTQTKALMRDPASVWQHLLREGDLFQKALQSL